MKRRGAYIGAVGLLIVAAGGWIVWSKMAPPTVSESAPVAPGPKPEAEPADDGEWNTYHGDGALRGIADAVLSDAPAILWRIKTGAPVRQTPVVHNGRVFAATARGEMFAVDFNGQTIWSRELFSGKTSSDEQARARIEAPIACFVGLVFIGTDDGALIALHAETGQERWRATIGGAIRGAPNYLQGRVFVIEQPTGVLVCLDAETGAVAWRAEGVERSDCSPAVSPEAIVFGSCAAALHVISPESGARLHDTEIDPDSQVAGGAALADGAIFVGCRSGKVVQADAKTGKILWTSQAGETEVFATPAVNADWVIASLYDGFVYGLARATGEIRWRFDTGGMPLSPVIAGDKVVVAADGDLILLRVADGLKVWSMHVSDEITSPAITRRRIFVGSEDGTLIAFGAPQHEGQ